MVKKLFVKMGIVSSALMTSMCLYLGAGGLGAFGGYAMSPDSVAAGAAVSEDALWDAAARELKARGAAVSLERDTGEIRRLDPDGEIVFRIEEPAGGRLRFRVEARRGWLPMGRRAARVRDGILKRLEGDVSSKRLVDNAETAG